LFENSFDQKRIYADTSPNPKAQWSYRSDEMASFFNQVYMVTQGKNDKQWNFLGSVPVKQSFWTSRFWKRYLSKDYCQSEAKYWWKFSPTLSLSHNL